MTKDNLIGIFRCDYSLTLKHKYGDFADQSAQVMRNAGYEGDFKVYDVIKSQYPTEEELAQLKGIWITGSVDDAFGDVPWINELCDYLYKLYTTHPGIRIVGICFGHQIIGRVFGCGVGRNPKGWEFGTYPVEVSKDSDVQELFEQVKGSFKIVEVHQDIVFDIPRGFKSIGSTQLAPVQGLYQRDRVLTFQGHPEFTLAFLVDLLDARSKAGKFTDEQVKRFETRLIADQGVEITRVILKFLLETRTNRLVN